MHAGVLECLFRLHKWPQGLDDNESHWRSGAPRLVRGITARHAREAAEQGVLPEAHLRGIMAVPGCAPGPYLYRNRIQPPCMS